MARTKASERAPKASINATLMGAGPSSLNMSDKRHLESPCPSSSPRIKRPRNESRRDLGSTGAYTGETRKRVHELEQDRCKAWVGASPSSARTWNSFTICVCACSSVNRPIFATVVPRTLVPTLFHVHGIILEITNRDSLGGHFTDFDGNSLFSLERNWENYLACGLPGIIWHEQQGKHMHVLLTQQIADTRLSDRLDADYHERLALAMTARTNAPLDARPSGRDGYPRRNGDSLVEKEQATPPPHRVTLKQEDGEEEDEDCESPERVPWTAMTSSSGRITQLDNSDLRSSIKRQPLRNVFDDAQESPHSKNMRLPEYAREFMRYG